MSPVKLSHTQKLDLLLELANDSKKKQDEHTNALHKIDITLGRHKVALAGYGTVIGFILAAIMKTFFV